MEKTCSLALKRAEVRIKGRVSFPSPGDLPDPGIELTSLVSSCIGIWIFFFFFFFTAELSGKPRNDFREPRFLHFPIHRKALKSLPQNASFLFF